MRIAPSEQKALLGLIDQRGRLVRPGRKLAVCRDPDDDIFLECAEAARADYLITGNKKHFPAYWQMTKVVNARELIDIIAPHLPI